jgi:hypothetical protein
MTVIYKYEAVLGVEFNAPEKITFEASEAFGFNYWCDANAPIDRLYIIVGTGEDFRMQGDGWELMSTSTYTDASGFRWVFHLLRWK